MDLSYAKSQLATITNQLTTDYSNSRAFLDLTSLGGNDYSAGYPASADIVTESAMIITAASVVEHIMYNNYLRSINIGLLSGYIPRTSGKFDTTLHLNYVRTRAV